jgi:hypothetical protein
VGTPLCSGKSLPAAWIDDNRKSVKEIAIRPIGTIKVQKLQKIKH